MDFVLTPMTGFVAGIVAYPDGSPVPGKKVVVGGLYGLVRGATDEEGCFRFERIDGDNLYVQVGKPGRFGTEGDPEWLYVQGFVAGADDLRLVLEPLGVLTGHILVPEGEPAAARVSFEGELGYHDWITAKDVAFEQPLQPDTYRVVVQTTSSSCTLEDVIVESNMTTDLGEIELIPQVPTN